MINYEIRITNYVELAVYNVLGQKVQTLINQRQRVGSYKVKFDGHHLSNGLYLYQLITAEGQQQTRKMLLIK